MTPLNYSQNQISLPAITDRIKLWFDSKLKAGAYAKARKAGAFAISVKDLLEMQEAPWVAPFPDFPNQAAKIDAFIKAIKATSFPIRYDGTIGFGDSILAFSAAHLTALDPLFNFAEPGSASLNFVTVAQALAPVLAAQKFNVKNVILGTIWGNAMLGHQDVNQAVIDAKQTFGAIRSLFPSARIIVYSAPRIYDLYANLNRPELDELLKSLVVGDGNAAYVDLTAGTAGFLGILPKAWATNEGIHLSDEMYPIFDDRIRRAKIATAGSIIS